jgi:4-cresol dehydrogenase (hydroxylating)
VGPYLDGLFTQSNFGVVTQMGLWLMPKPEHFELCVFRCERDEGIDELVTATRHLLLNGTVRSYINLMHRNRILTMIQQYPWEEMGGQTPMSDDVAQRLAKQNGIGAWTGILGLYGTRGEVRAARGTVRRRLKGITDRLHFISERKLWQLENLPAAIARCFGLDFGRLSSAVRPAFGILSGVPSAIELNSPYWRAKDAKPSNTTRPSFDKCGLVWFSPVVPMTVDCVQEFQRMVAPTLAKYGFDCCITFTSVTARAFDCTLPILFDNTDEEERQKARACYDELAAQCAVRGYFPYRVGTQSMAHLSRGSHVFWDVCQEIKSSLDPDNIIAPGRYQPKPFGRALSN